ncbi:hypothetical protein ES703_52909 [subsurface metagenome]
MKLMEVKKMTGKEKKRLANCEPTSPQRKTEARRLLDSKIAEIESQDSLLLFLFVENCPKILTEPMIQLVWDFLEFLKSHGYLIVHQKEVFCVPFGKLVCKADLK